jgi:ankyrin repeat protein
LSDDTEWSAFGGLHGPEKLQFVKLLLARGADPNNRARRAPSFGIQVKGVGGSVVGGTPFLIAAGADDVTVMLELVAHGTDPLAAAKNGTTPLMIAAGVGHVPGLSRSTEREALEAVKLCLELGGDVNAANTAGDTALHGAAWRERADSIVQFLVDHGANMNAKNNRGWTPLVIAEGIWTANNYVHSETTTALMRKLGAAPSPPGISREPQAADEQ